MFGLIWVWLKDLFAFIWFVAGYFTWNTWIDSHSIWILWRKNAWLAPTLSYRWIGVPWGSIVYRSILEEFHQQWGTSSSWENIQPRTAQNWMFLSECCGRPFLVQVNQNFEHLSREMAQVSDLVTRTQQERPRAGRERGLQGFPVAIWNKLRMDQNKVYDHNGGNFEHSKGYSVDLREVNRRGTKSIDWRQPVYHCLPRQVKYIYIYIATSSSNVISMGMWLCNDSAGSSLVTRETNGSLMFFAFCTTNPGRDL